MVERSKNTGSALARASARAARHSAWACLAALALSGCSGYVDRLDNTAAFPVSYEERYPIEVERHIATLNIAPSRRARGLGEQQYRELVAFLEAFNANGSGHLVVTRPLGRRGNFAAEAAVADIKRAIDANGIPRERVAFARTRSRGPVTLSFKRYQALTAPCGDWSTNLARTYTNRPFPNLGCATQANLATLVANPRDLEVPRTQDPADAARRDKILAKYREGEVTAAQKGEDDKAQVSQVSP